MRFKMNRIRAYLPIIAYAIMAFLTTVSDSVHQYVFPEVLMGGFDGFFVYFLCTFIIGFIAPLFWVVHFIGYLFGHPLKDMWHASLVLGSLFYGSIIYWIWCLENEVYDVNADNMGCPHCHKKLQTRRIPEKTDRLPYQSPDTVTTKRYNADGDYIGHEETETGTSTTKYLIQETYKCEKCGHKWIVSF